MKVMLLDAMMKVLHAVHDVPNETAMVTRMYRLGSKYYQVQQYDPWKDAYICCEVLPPYKLTAEPGK